MFQINEKYFTKQVVTLLQSLQIRCVSLPPAGTGGYSKLALAEHGKVISTAAGNGGYSSPGHRDFLYK